MYSTRAVTPLMTTARMTKGITTDLSIVDIRVISAGFIVFIDIII